MAPDAGKPKGVFTGLAVNQNHVWFDVAITKALVWPRQWMNTIFDRQRLVDNQQFQHRFKQLVEIAMVGMGVESLQFFPKNSGGFNCPH